MSDLKQMYVINDVETKLSEKEPSVPNSIGQDCSKIVRLIKCHVILKRTIT